MPKVLVTGCAGLIGSHLVDALLEKGNDVVGFDNLSVGKLSNIEPNLKNSRFRFHNVDVCDFGQVLENRDLYKELDVIVHLASAKKPYETAHESSMLLQNVHATENMLEVARTEECKFVFASSSDVYGYGKIPMKETDDLCLGASNIKRWSYAISKIYGEHLCFGYYQDFKVPIIVLRYFGCFGERASISWSGGHAMVFINAILHDEEVAIHGDGKQTRSMCYVGDVVDGTIRAIETPDAVGEIINIGGTDEMSVLDFALLAGRVLGKEPKLKFVPFRNVAGDYREIMRRLPDLSKAKRILGFNPKTPTTKAIEATAKWIQEEL